MKRVGNEHRQAQPSSHVVKEGSIVTTVRHQVINTKPLDMNKRVVLYIHNGSTVSECCDAADIKRSAAWCSSTEHAHVHCCYTCIYTWTRQPRRDG